ncbi:MAG: hypothetical protein U0842_25070 [Candidatus Binatia bacterium]
MAKEARVLALLALGMVMAACSGGGSGASAPSTPKAEVSREDYAQRLAEWLCDDLAACCDASGESVDRASCVDVKRKAELHRLASEESHGARVYDGAVAAECMAALDQEPASCGYERRVQRCFQTYDGIAALGEPCGGKVQCRGMASGDVSCIQGRCAERLPAGAECEMLSGATGGCDVCRGDARCREAASDGKSYCYGYERRRGVAGDKCVKDRDVYAFPPGQSPDDSVVFATCSLDDGLTCSPEGVCAPVAGAGEACAFGFYCMKGLRCEAGTCRPGLDAGATCRDSRACGEGLYCRWTETTCNERDPVTQQCLSEHLVSGVCSAPSAEGESCGKFVDCGSGLICARDQGGENGRCTALPRDYCDGGLQKLARQTSKLQ